MVLAAGEGVRLRPLTLTRPKHLIPVGGRPLLQHTLSALKAAGFKDVFLVVGYLREQIISNIGDGSEFGLKIVYVEQPTPTGTGDAIRVAREYVGNEDFLAVYGDLYVDSTVILDILEAYQRRKGNVLAVVEAERLENYGVVKLREDRSLEDLVEKPRRWFSPTNLVNAGVYIFTPNIFEYVRQTERSPRGEVEVTDAIKKAVEGGETIYTVEVSRDKWMDIGRPWDLLEANERYLKSMKPSVRGVIEDGAHIFGALNLEEDAVVKSGAYIEGPVYIGRGSQIGPNCYIRAYSSLGRDVRIGNGCEIKNSIIMNGTRIPHLSYVGDSIIGSGCNFGAGTMVGNIRFDEKPVKVLIGGEIVDTGRRKFGAVIGDRVKTGVNANFMPGTKVGPNCHIGANVIVYRDVPPNVKVKAKQHLIFENIKLETTN
ncbi:MAG: sugar phosphate nucleotidyltransferase [Candidatus Bathyarchaeia archaeon]